MPMMQCRLLSLFAESFIFREYGSMIDRAIRELDSRRPPAA
jgi:hypothetical protein